MTVLLFIAKLIISGGLLYGYYHLFLRNKRFHHYNRFYLLAIALFSIIIPFINIPVNLFAGNRQHTVLIRTLKVITAGGWEEPVTIYAHQGLWSKWISVQNGFYCVYTAGALLGFSLLLRSLAWISRLKKKYRYETIDDLKIYNTSEPGTPFSFFRSVFWDKAISLNNEKGQQIFRHEMFHVKEKHSADILLMEILCCAGWFNPFFHLIKKELKAIHEFLADEYAVSANNRYDYAELLVLQAIQQKGPAICHPFFHNQIKRRITMITQSNLIRRSGYISRIMALPLLFVLISAFAVKLTGKPASAPVSQRATKNITVVIDAGHGGEFEGTHNPGGITEKNINLDIAKKINALSAAYNITVTLTRNADALTGNASNLREDLMNRIQITNDAKADLFISIHVNATNKRNTDSTGFQALISGRKEDAKARQLASAILISLNSIYAVDDGVRQRQTGVLVLDKTTCPSVMLECGYLNNPKDAAFITDAGNQEKIARKILEGIVSYSNAQATTYPLPAEKINGDTISAAALSKLNVDEIKSIKADMTKNLVMVSFKNGRFSYANAAAVNEYYTEHQTDAPLPGYLTNVTMKDSLVNIAYHKDAVPAAFTARPANVQDTFTKVETEAVYPGGDPGWSGYLIRTLKYPAEAVKKNVQGTVVIQFIVDEYGKISDVKAISGPEALRAESIRVVKESGHWTSAVNHGKKVKAFKRQAISYQLSPLKT